MHFNIRIRRTGRSPSRMVFLIFLLMTFALYLVLCFLPKAPAEGAMPLDDIPARAAIKLPPLTKHTEIIPFGRSLSDILGSHHIGAAQIHRLREDAKPVYDLAKIKAGQEVRLYTFSDGTLVALEYDIDRMSFLLLEKRNGTYTASLRHREFEILEKLVIGTISDFPINALARLGETAPLAIMLEEIFAWDVDFRTEIQPGDSFKILCEKKYIEGEFAGYGNILAAEFTNQGRRFTAFRYTYEDTGKTDYFDRNGNSLRKEFLKSPLKAPRITSRFSSSRLHPVWKTYRPHYGVDYGAPVGTRVYATADGVVTSAGWSGASGRMIRIRHNKGYETMYLHLRRFASGIKRGARITSGQYIAQVGASGAVSGPHLDYRIKHHGKYINPLAARFEPVEPLRRDFLADFQRKADYLTVIFDSPWILYASFAGASLRPSPVEIAD